MKIFIGADHRGFALKEKLKPWLQSLGHDVLDCGNTVLDPHDDYPDFTFKVADAVVANPGSLGIVMCGSGGGVVIAANKVSGIRAVLGDSVPDTKHNRDHNDVNVLSLTADFTNEEQSKELVKVFLDTPFAAEERMVRRLRKIEERETGSL